MDRLELLQELNLAGKGVGISRLSTNEDQEKLRNGCTLALLKKVMAGETVIVTAANDGCYGAKTGFGLVDDLPKTPGGFGHFLSYGKGEGYPAGERVKKDPELAEQFILNQPKNIMRGNNAIKLEPYDQATSPELVSFMVTPDQLSALIHLYNYEKIDYDNVIVPMTSGCASIVRIPLAELEKGKDARAVIGNVDVFSRPHFPADTFFFTIPHESFEAMVRDSEENVLVSPIWKAVRKRIHS